MRAADKDPRVSKRDLWLMMLCTVRYAMGRQSYVVGEACDLVRTHRHWLAPEQVVQIAREIREELEYAARCGRTVGGTIDDAAWRRLLGELLDA